MQDRLFSDEELVAYLDGEQDFAPVADIEQALKDDVALQRRVAALEIDRDALRDEFATLIPDGLGVPSAPVQRPRRGLWGAVTGGAVAAALAIGFALGSAQTAKLETWAEYVAAYQALYSNSTLAHLEVAVAEQQSELDRVAASIGKEISVEDLSVFPDVAYRRSQILSYEGRALIQLAFLNSMGEPVALCIIRSDAAARDAVADVVEMEGLSTALWSTDGYDYILIGGTDDALISRMSAGFIAMQI